MDTEQVFKVILRRHFNIEPENVTRESRIEQDLGLDNVEESELQEIVEREFRVTFSPYECDNMQTVGDYIFAIENRKTI